MVSTSHVDSFEFCCANEFCCEIQAVSCFLSRTCFWLKTWSAYAAYLWRTAKNKSFRL